MNLTLTIREEQILHLISQGYSSKEIADLLYLSFETIKTYRYRLTNKFEARNVAHMIRIAAECGIFKKDINNQTYFNISVA